MKILDAVKVVKRLENDIKKECKASGVELTYEVEQTMYISLSLFQDYLTENNLCLPNKK